ncbi:hypothetical protein H6F95_05375 [Cyanobacteria bacterium FACHB-471]|nr:hypothetical protein [Cyanobacteria bacterium FACHB-471]
MAHRILIAVYHMLNKQQPFQDLGTTHLDEHHKDHLLKQMCSRIQQLGY